MVKKRIHSHPEEDSSSYTRERKNRRKKSPVSIHSDCAESSNKNNMLRFKKPLADENWPCSADGDLFKELLEARLQGFNYIGLKWNREDMWEKICQQLNEKRHSITYSIDEVKDRVERYSRSFDIKGKKLFENKYQIEHIGPLVFQKSVDNGPPSVPKSGRPKPSTTTSTTSKKSVNLLRFRTDTNWPEFRDTKLFEQLNQARKQESKYLGLVWKDDNMWTTLHKEINIVFRKFGLEEADKEDIMDRVRAYKKCYKKFGAHAFHDQLRATIREGLDVFDEEKNIGPPIVPRTSNSKRSRDTLNIESSTHGGRMRSGFSQEADTPRLSLVKEIEKITDLSIEEQLWAINHFLNSEDKFFDMNENMRSQYIKMFFVQRT